MGAGGEEGGAVMTITIQKASNGWIVTVMATSGSLAGQLFVPTIATDAALLDVVAQVTGIERESVGECGADPRDSTPHDTATARAKGTGE